MKIKSMVLLIICLGLILSGCQRQSDKVSYNLSKEADNFNIVRKLTVINGITDDVSFQMTGRLSIETPSAKKLEIVVEHGVNDYRKHFVLLGDNTTVTVEDMGLGANDVSKYKYTMNYNPKMWVPIDIKTID